MTYPHLQMLGLPSCIFRIYVRLSLFYMMIHDDPRYHTPLISRGISSEIPWNSSSGWQWHGLRHHGTLVQRGQQHLSRHSLLQSYGGTWDTWVILGHPGTSWDLGSGAGLNQRILVLGLNHENNGVPFENDGLNGKKIRESTRKCGCSWEMVEYTSLVN